MIVTPCGIIYVLRQLLILVNELNWLNQLLKGSKTKLSVKSPNLLKYLDTFQGTVRQSIFSQSMKSIMESLDARLAETEKSQASYWFISFFSLLEHSGDF